MRRQGQATQAVGRASVGWCREPGVDVGQAASRTSAGARDAVIEPLARAASSSSVKPSAVRASSYWSASRDPNSSGSSAPEPRVCRARRWCAGAPPRGCRRPRARRCSAGRPRGRRPTRRPARAPAGPRRCARRGRSGRAGSPRASPRRRSGRAAPRRGAPGPVRPVCAMAKAGAKSAVWPRRSSLLRPNPTTAPASVAGVLGGEAGQGPGVERVADPAGGDHDGHLGRPPRGTPRQPRRGRSREPA